MPPLKGIERGIDGNLLKALEETGHGDQIVIVDPSFPIPEGSRVETYHGDSSSKALEGILDLVPVEEDQQILLMSSDAETTTGTAVGAEFEDYLMPRDLRYRYIYRTDDEVESGFYTLANDSPENRPTLYVRTRDERAFACAMFIVGHSQS